MVAVGNGDILEASRHLSAGGFSPATNPAPVNDGAGAQHSVAALGLPGDEVRGGRVHGDRETDSIAAHLEHNRPKKKDFGFET